MDKLGSFVYPVVLVMLTALLIKSDLFLLSQPGFPGLLGLAIVVGCLLHLIARTLGKCFGAHERKGREELEQIVRDLNQAASAHGRPDAFSTLEPLLRKRDHASRHEAIVCLSGELTCGLCALALIIAGALSHTASLGLWAAGMVLFGIWWERSRRQAPRNLLRLKDRLLEIKAIAERLPKA